MLTPDVDDSTYMASRPVEASASIRIGVSKAPLKSMANISEAAHTKMAEMRAFLMMAF